MSYCVEYCFDKLTACLGSYTAEAVVMHTTQRSAGSFFINSDQLCFDMATEILLVYAGTSTL